LRTILGWAFLGIAGNVINDAVDKDHETGWHVKELAAIALGSLALSLLCFIDAVIANPVNAAWIVIAIVLVLSYNVGLKKIPLASGFLQVLAEVCMPYFTIHVPSTPIEWLWLVALYFFGVLSQFMHEAIDKEAITKRFTPAQVRTIVFLFSILVLGAGSLLFLLTLDMNILPIAFVPVACIYIFRVPRTSAASNIKNVGIILGNFFMIYFLVLILASLAA